MLKSYLASNKQCFPFRLDVRNRKYVYFVYATVHTYLKTLNIWNGCQVYSVECVSKIKLVISIILLR